MFKITDFHMQPATLYYIKEEFSFNTLPVSWDVKGSIMVNDVIINFNSEEDLTQVWGYCPYHSWIQKNIQLPFCRNTGLRVTEEIPDGTSARINETRLSVFFNPFENIICMGDPSKEMDFFHFAPGAIMGLRNMKFMSLWLFFTLVDKHPNS